MKHVWVVYFECATDATLSEWAPRFELFETREAAQKYCKSLDCSARARFADYFKKEVN